MELINNENCSLTLNYNLDTNVKMMLSPPPKTKQNTELKPDITVKHVQQGPILHNNSFNFDQI